VDQALSNVIGNALKFSPSGRPVEVIARRAGGEVEVAVVDHGPGISPPDLAGLFQKFSRGAASEGTEGTGLGLYMTQALMTAQGGRITVASKVGEGSRFTLHFPAVTEGDDT
jgi:signal transduction histidine kinase